MALEDQLRTLDLSGESKRHGAKVVQLSYNEDGTVQLSTKDPQLDLSEAQTALQRLFDINKQSNLTIDTLGDIDAEIKTLAEKVKSSITNLRIACENEEQDNELEEFSQTVALLTANLTVNDFIKTEIHESLIDKMTLVYIEILNLLRDHKFKTSNFLLTRVSLISPLLITISFSYKLRSPSSSSLMKILSILFTYSIQNNDMLQSVIKLFAISSTTNIEMFEVFNKLWENTLEDSVGFQLTDKHIPGPISVSNRIKHLQDYEISTTLLNNIFPYSQNQYIRQLSRNTLKLHSILTNIKSGNKVSKHLTELIGFTSDKCALETLFILLETLGMQNNILELFDGGEFTTQLGYIFSKLSEVSAPAGDQSFHAAIQKRVMDKDHLTQLETSLSIRFKVLLEIIDHNLTIDFQKEATWSISLVNALNSIDADFDLVESHLTLSELGSSLSLSAIIINVSYILSDAILKIVNPSRDISTHLKLNISFQKLPPLPKSEFLDYSNSFISPSQVNLGNLQRVINSLHYCLSILNKINLGYNEKKEWIYPVQDIELNEDDIKYQVADKYLSLTYSSLFSVLTVADELLQKSKRYNQSDVSPVFFDLASISNTFEAQIFRAFENIFYLYDTFAFFKLMKMTMKISMNDLELQKFSIKVLNHLIFHSGTGIKSKIENNDVIMRLLAQYVSLWNDNSVEYDEFSTLLNTPSSTVNETVIFDTKHYLNLLGFDDAEILQSSSPATATSTHSSSDSYSLSSNNTNGFNINNISQPVATPNTFNGNTINKQPILQDTSYFNPQNFNYNATTQFNNNNLNQFQNNTGPLSAGAMEYGYRTSNIRNVQSFVPQSYAGQNQNNRAQSVHVDQLGNFE